MVHIPQFSYHHQTTWGQVFLQQRTTIMKLSRDVCGLFWTGGDREHGQCVTLLILSSVKSSLPHPPNYKMSKK